MKPIIPTIFLLLLSTCFTLKSSFKSGVSFQGLHIDKISSLGSAMKALIQIANGDEYEQVINILTQVSAEFSNLVVKNQGALSDENTRYEDSSKTADENIELLSTKLDKTNQDLEQKKELQASLRESIGKNNAAIKDAQDQTGAEGKRRNEVNTNHKSQIKAIEQTLQAIAEATEIIERVKTANSQIMGLSFIQSQKKKLGKQLGVVHQKMASTNLKTSPMNFYVNQLIQIAEEASADDADNDAVVELMAKVSSMLNDFKTSLTTNKGNIEEADAEDAKRSASTLEALSKIIEAQQAALGENQKSAEKNDEKITNLENESEALSTAKEQAEANRDVAEQVHDEKAGALQGYIDRLTKDVDVLQRAIAFVKQQSVPPLENNE